MTAEVKQNSRNIMQAELPVPFRLSVAGLELIAVVTLAFFSANLVLFFIEKNTAAEIPTTVQASSATSDNMGDASKITYLKTVDAFYPNNQIIDQQPTAALPESTLDVKIFGIRANGGGDGTVILTSQGSVQQLAQVGSEIAPNTVLTAIYQDRIEFRRSGRMETIYLDEDRMASPLSNSTTSHAPETSAVPEDVISGFINALALSPYRNGRSIAGFVIGPDSDRALLILAGLEVGDIISVVNGNELHSWERVSEIPEEAQSGTLELKLERRGEPLSLSISTSILGQ